MQFSIQPLLKWTITSAAVIGFSIFKISNQKKEQEYQKKIEIAENKIQELIDLNIKNQQNTNNPTVNQTKTIITHPDLEYREKKIIKYIIEGKSNKEIASEFHMSQGGLSNAITPIYKKLGIENRVQLITYFVKNDLLDWISKD